METRLVRAMRVAAAFAVFSCSTGQFGELDSSAGGGGFGGEGAASATSAGGAGLGEGGSGGDEAASSVASASSSASSVSSSASSSASTGSGPPPPPPPPPQVIYVNFDGVTVNDCSNYCSDAPTNRSWAIGAHFGKSAVAFAPYTNASGRKIVVDGLVAAFSPYNVAVKTARPASGPFTMVIVSTTTGPNHGVAPLDCLNQNPNDIAFVYKIGSASADTVRRYATHELGHSFGLEHVVGADDFMQWASSGSKFTVSTYDHAKPSGHDCLSSDVQDAPAMLLAALGKAP